MYVPIYISLLTKHLVRGLHASCCALVSVSAECCGYLCYPSAVMRQWPLWSNPVPLSLIRCTCVVPLFLRCCVICHMVLIAQCGKVLRLPLRSYRLYNWISQFRFDTTCDRGSDTISLKRVHHNSLKVCPKRNQSGIRTCGRWVTVCNWQRIPSQITQRRSPKYREITNRCHTNRHTVHLQTSHEIATQIQMARGHKGQI